MKDVTNISREVISINPASRSKILDQIGKRNGFLSRLKLVSSIAYMLKSLVLNIEIYTIAIAPYVSINGVVIDKANLAVYKKWVLLNSLK